MGEICKCEGQICLEAWGSIEGEKWKYPATFGISQIIIKHGETIDSITFISAHSFAKFGGNGGVTTINIKLDPPSEYLIGISGSSGRSRFGDNIRSLKFHTNRSVYGPFGHWQGTPFAVIAQGTPFSFVAKDGMITAFHGWAAQYLNAIGVCIAPLCSHAKKKPNSEMARNLGFQGLPRSAAAWGGNGGREWDDGVFSAVKGAHVRVRVDSGVVCGVRFTYLKEDGSEFLSPLHGCSCGVETRRKTIVFGEEGEWLMGVEGFCGAMEGENVVRSVTFITNKGKYGPFGGEIGTYFRSVNGLDCKRKVVGFHGRSGAYLDAIGLHAQYE